MEIFHIHFSDIYHLIYTAPCTRADGRQIDRLVQELIEMLPQVTEFLKSYDRELMWVYPFAWIVIIVRKLFYA